MPTTTPKSLWTDRPDDWLSAQAEEPTHVAPSAPPPSPRPRGRRALTAVVAAIALAGGAGALVLDSRDDASTTTQAAATLPAASGRAAPTDVGSIYAKASKAVVSVQVAQGSGAASGTGFLIDGDGTIVTNAHVVGDASSARVRFDDDARPVTAEVVGTDPSSDLAVLRVAPGAADGVQPLQLASSKDVAVGDTAIAIGYPLGLDRTATSGIVSGLGREIRAPNGFSIDEVIQTDAPINPGNSGGPLLDAAGRVIGVNSQIATAGGGGGNVGIGFAVPSDTVREVVPKLKAGTAIQRAWLGVSTAQSPSGAGAVVAAVTPGGPAADAGLRPGDRILSLGGVTVGDSDDVATAVSRASAGDRMEVRIERDGREQTLAVELGTRPERTP
jgi:putative serine protease PepD